MISKRNIIFSLFLIFNSFRLYAEINSVSHGWGLFNRVSDSRITSLSFSTIAYPIKSSGISLVNPALSSIYNEKICVVVEHVTAMPGQGVTSMFNFGQSFGVIKGICSAMQLPIHFVRPAKWKKYFNLIKTTKDASRSRAIEVFPKVSDKLKRKKDSNKADAILIASYYYNTYKSE